MENQDFKRSICELIQPLKSAIQLLGYVVTDAAINSDGTTWLKTSNGKIENVGKTMSSHAIKQVATLLASVSGQSLNENIPCLSATIPGTTERVEILIPPAVKSPVLSLRFHKKTVLSLFELVSANMLTHSQAKFLSELVAQKMNIVISGATGSGKTTLLNALVNIIDPTERVVIVEEATNEINCVLPNVLSILTNKTVFTGRMAIMSAMRLNPDRIVYGECRDGGSALECLKAWRTGHEGGLTTIHANSAACIKGRFSDLLLEVCEGNMSELINDAIDVGVFVKEDNGQRTVKEIKVFNYSKWSDNPGYLVAQGC